MIHAEAVAPCLTSNRPACWIRQGLSCAKLTRVTALPDLRLPVPPLPLAPSCALQFGRGGLGTRVPVRPPRALAADPVPLARHALFALEASDKRQVVEAAHVASWVYAGKKKGSLPDRIGARRQYRLDRSRPGWLGCEPVQKVELLGLAAHAALSSPAHSRPMVVWWTL